MMQEINSLQCESVCVRVCVYLEPMWTKVMSACLEHQDVMTKGAICKKQIQQIERRSSGGDWATPTQMEDPSVIASRQVSDLIHI